MISIIIPAYNAALTIKKTIESVLNQDYHNFELIIVDDGSMDNTFEACKTFAEKDSRVRIFHQENAGVTAARKSGVAKSNGEWIMFVDADDLLAKNTLTRFSYFSKDVDIVSASAFFCDKDCKNPQKSSIKALNEKLDGFLYAKKLIMGKILWTPWSKLINKRLFSDEIFNLPAEIKEGEDLIMNLRLAMKADIIRCIPDELYLYRAPTVSHKMNLKGKILQLFYICSSVKKNKSLCILGAYKWLYRILRKAVFNR